MDSHLQKIAEELVRTRITGTRKGSDALQFKHSFRVAETLRRFEYGDDAVLAGLLHDIIEDSDTTFDELRAMGFSGRVIELVGLCTHKDEIENTDARWTEMIGRLIVARDEDAWAIKAADLADNVHDSDSMREERKRFMRAVKGPLLLAASKDVIGDSGPWQALETVLLEVATA